MFSFVDNVIMNISQQNENTTHITQPHLYDSAPRIFPTLLIVVMTLTFCCAFISIIYTTRAQQNSSLTRTRALHRVQTFVSSIDVEEEEEEEEKNKTIL